MTIAQNIVSPRPIRQGYLVANRVHVLHVPALLFQLGIDKDPRKCLILTAHECMLSEPFISCIPNTLLSVIFQSFLLHSHE